MKPPLEAGAQSAAVAPERVPELRRLFAELSLATRALFARPRSHDGRAEDGQAGPDLLADASRTVVTERSFAGELAALLPPYPAASAPSSETAHVERGAAPQQNHDPEPELEPEARVASETRHEAARAAAPEPELLEAVCTPLAVTPPSARLERIVPLTRLPLRRRHASVGWPASTSAANAAMSRSERHAFLSAAEHSREHGLGETLVRAYREEDDDGRLLALRALRRGKHPGARDVFVDALRTGTDDERSLALDALHELGEHDVLAAAFGDRLDALVARAALAFVGHAPRATYRTILQRYLEPARLDAVLELLAGIVE